MSSSASPVDMRSYIVERLTGASGAADHVTAAARALGERCLPALAKQLAADLSSPVEIEIEAIELGRQAEVLQQAAQNDAMTVVSSTVSGDAMVLLVDAPAISVLVNALFGGEPEMATAIIDRDLSAIEVDVAALVFDQVAHILQGSGSRSLNLRFPLVRPVSGAELKKQTLRDGPSVRIVFSIFTTAGSGNLVLSMPQRVLLQYRSGTAPAQEAEAAGGSDWSARFSDKVIRSAVKVEATIPIGRMKLGELAQLREGQIIEMPAAAQTGTRLIARDKVLFLGEFGKLGQHYTIRIRQPFDARQDLIDGILPA